MTALCSSYLFLSCNNASYRSLHRNPQIIKRGYGISLCPKAHFARVLERVVSGFDFLAAVVIASDLIAHGLHPEFVPFSCGHLKVGSRELAASAVYHVIEPVIVLKGVCANDVVVVRIF